MKHYAIDGETLQQVANYITNNPSPTMPVGMAIQIIGKLQALPELPDASVPKKNAPGPNGQGDQPTAE